jgi:hypothetical protein
MISSVRIQAKVKEFAGARKKPIPIIYPFGIGSNDPVAQRFAQLKVVWEQEFHCPSPRCIVSRRNMMLAGPDLFVSSTLEGIVHQKNMIQLPAICSRNITDIDDPMQHSYSVDRS